MLNSSYNQNFSFGVLMSLRRVGRLAAMLLPTLLCLSCGQVYRPVVIPCSEGGIPGCPPQTPAIPSSFHAVFALSANAANNPGGALQIDVSGDTIIAETPTSDQSEPNLGDIPTYAAILPNNSKVFVTSAGSLLPGGIDIVSSFAPAAQSTIATGFGPVTSVNLPTGSQPVFVTSTQNNVAYVANFGTNSVSVINISNVLTNTVPVGVQPVALAETPNGLKLYVANQGSNSVSSLNTADLSSNPVTGFSGINPVWVVARGDSQKIYVLTQGDGQLVTIDEATDTVTSSLAVGAGANFLLYDPHLNRLYVTNPATSMVYVFSDTGGANAGVANDTPVQLAAISFAPASASAPVPCPAVPTSPGCLPTSVAALPDGSRFYVASYQIASTCPDALAGVTGACVIAGLTVFDANSFAPDYPTALTYPSAATLPLLTYPPFAANLTANQYQYAVPPAASCAAPALYGPGTTRFRVFTTAAADSTHVYVSMCDAGAIAVINTNGSNTNNSGGSHTPADALATDLPAAFSAGPALPNGEPPLQNPIFMLTGQ
jgi:DNA-binding beta-propeller fold protein YncE